MAIGMSRLPIWGLETMTVFARAFAITFAAVLCAAGAANADVRQGITDFQRGNFSAAINELTPHVDQGDAMAQHVLGQIYSAGLGVAKDQQRAVALFKRAAESGQPEAQFDLGRSLALGEGVEQDLIEAMKWFILAADTGHKDAVIYVQETSKSMTRTDLSTSRVRALNWQKEFTARGGRLRGSSLAQPAIASPA